MFKEEQGSLNHQVGVSYSSLLSFGWVSEGFVQKCRTFARKR